MICVQLLAGLADGFGRSPYDHSVAGIVMNIFSIGAVLAGREFFRSYIVNTLIKKENYIVFLSVSLFLTALAFPVQKYLDLQGYESTVKFFAQFFLPEFSRIFWRLIWYFWEDRPHPCYFWEHWKHFIGCLPFSLISNGLRQHP